MKWVLKNGQWVERPNFLEAAIIGLGYVYGFMWHRGVVPFCHFMYDWMYAPRMAHSRAAGLLLIAIIFFGMLCIL